MAFIGMDVEAVRQLATQMDSKATDIDTIMNTLNSTLGNTDWLGTDATNFRNDWSTVHMVNLRNVANALRNAATAARTNATEQDNASNKYDQPCGGRSDEAGARCRQVSE